MSATALPASSSATSTCSNNALQSSGSVPRQSWPCNSCEISFNSSQAQRQHMKEPWHVYNVKRRLASLAPIPFDMFKDRVQPKLEPVGTVNDESSQSESEEETVSPQQCLFCPEKFEDDTDEFKNLLEHMYAVHGLYIPDQDSLVDTESFLGYLATQVRMWHECLHCGTTRDTTLAIQSHMRDSGHCMLNLDREPELLEFWERIDQVPDDSSKQLNRAKMVFGKELHFPSGKVVSSREGHQRRNAASRARDDRLVLKPAKLHAEATPQPSKKCGSLQLARRDEMGIMNITSQQRQALVLAAQRSQKSEEIATRAREWSNNRQANSQKHDQNHGPLSWAKAGLHNLLPR